MNISYRPRWMAVFCSLITTGLAKNQYSIRCTKPTKYQFSWGWKTFQSTNLRKKFVSLQQFRLLQKPSHNSMRQHEGLEGGELEACRLLNVVRSII
jgi:hypothetical protein